MNLQNIIINFTDSTVSTMFEDKHHSIDAIGSILPIKKTFSTAYNLDFDFVVVQLSEDQHLSEPRILLSKNDEISFVTIVDVATNHADLYLELKNIRAIIETELSTILNAQNGN